ncbi:hypothetical protein [Accumulibacter sp.]|uniref:hypothetical protein n=1 Tax=Accumulibacter sp. TaxID=2053492 RepID=UPI0025F5FEB2|nr:hypothetical protein [Accumulibacter sp.]MCM8594841.1 hypothetical protein [Accumulibacter sp.]MDS4048987.1 hypothetical protein [Accumulibacter sp.]
MRIRHTLLVTALVAGLAPGTGTLAGDTHHHAAGEPSRLSLDHGRKWATDAPLRSGMSEIRQALAAKLEGIHKRALTPAEYRALGVTVEAQVAGIVAECKLAPAADANLHLIVAELSAGADALQGKSAVEPAVGALQTVQAVNRYGQYFDHPGWKPLR